MVEDVRISIPELRKRMDEGEEFLFIDTRNAQAWAESDLKLPGALRLPVAEAEEQIAEIPRGKPIVTYCT